jgi:hypothetical protein
MPRAGFEAAIPMFERPKTVLALDRARLLRPASVYFERVISLSGPYVSELPRGQCIPYTVNTTSHHMRVIREHPDVCIATENIPRYLLT